MSASKKIKGQALTPDFTMSIVIFTAILFLSTTLWNISYERTSWLYETEHMQNKAFYISSILINTPGIPDDWNQSSVKMIGLKEKNSEYLDLDKIAEYKMLDYNYTKELLGVGSYEYYINITTPDDTTLKVGGAIEGTAAVFARDENDNIIKELLKNYYDDWDYYWAGAGTPSNNATRVYYKSDASPPTEAGLFKMLISNISSYDTLIIEGEQIPDPDNSDKEKLRDFVYEGGTLIDLKDKNNAQLINHFPGIPSGESASAADKEGTVINKDIILPNSKVGDNITFQSAKFKFNMTYVDKPIVESNGSAGYCTLCLWHYGSGKVYYLMEGEKADDVPINGLDLEGTDLRFGDNTTIEGDNIVVIKRLVFIEDGKLVKMGTMHLYLYK